jgi:hypothetical protein
LQAPLIHPSIIGVIPDNAQWVKQCLQFFEDPVLALAKHIRKYLVGYMVDSIPQPTWIKFIALGRTRRVIDEFLSILPCWFKTSAFRPKGAPATSEVAFLGAD